MHEDNIDILRSEAQRLIEMEVNLLRKMMDEPGVIAKAKDGEIQTFDRDATCKHIEVLMGENTKLESLDMVLAVVGTMKAGKSTSINAIVGTEVLPNRNRPMTALPTLIRHTVGQIEPILKFDNNEPIHQLMVKLRAAIVADENQGVLKKLTVDADMKDLLDFIGRGEKYLSIYQGADGIFEFLKNLNDLVRLSRELDIDFPFADYDEIHEMPVIEVEFAHLREIAQSTGRLTLLDTPGPNESGQPHLRKMLREQLGKASAVLAILDFTQLKSDADAEVRRELKEIADVSAGRLFTLVNKFDQKDRHGDSEDEVKTFVASNLMDERISSEDVFPVSSRWGYLANRARHELFVSKKLPDPKLHPWVVDFGEEAFGRRWESKIDDLEEVKESAEKLWEESLFQVPLEGVIRTAHARAAGFAIDSAAAKLVEMAEKMDNLLTTRVTALSKSARELQGHISALQEDIVRVEASEKSAKSKAKKVIEDLSNETKNAFTKVRSDAVESLESYFREGKRVELEGRVRQQNVDYEKNNSNSHMLKNLFGIDSNSSRRSSSQVTDFDATNPVMKFGSRSEAGSLVGKIQSSVADIVSQAEAIMKNSMDVVINSFQRDFSESVHGEAQLIINEMKDRLKGGGFSINLKLPSAAKISLSFSGAEMMNDIIGEKTKTVTRSRRKDSAWGTVCRWFNSDDWGWEEYKSTEVYYELDIRKVKHSSMTQIDAAFAGLDEAVSLYVKKPLDNAIADFFKGFKKSVEQIRGDLLQSIRDQEQSKVEQDALALRLKALKQDVPAILTDTRGLKQDVAPLIDANA